MMALFKCCYCHGDHRVIDDIKMTMDIDLSPIMCQYNYLWRSVHDSKLDQWRDWRGWGGVGGTMKKASKQARKKERKKKRS
jgi:hypothetical protein